MTDQPLVSIVTPCFNGEHYLHRFFNSILSQTYKNLELIFVNDGSTDKTEEVALSYKERLTNNKIKFIYISQENKGLGGAINAGLLKVTGKYLCWPDSDDYLEDESIEKRVRILEDNPDYAVVTSDAYIRDIDNLEKPLGLISGKNPNRFLKNQFELLLKGESIFCSGCHLVRVDSFRETHKDFQIYGAKRGQNWQILLPLYYKYKRFFLDIPLYNYVKYKNTMSDGDDSQEKLLYRCDEHIDILIHTIDSLDANYIEKSKFINIVRFVYARKKLNIAYKYRNRRLFDLQYKILMSHEQLNVTDKLLILTFNYKILGYFVVIVKKIKALARNVGNN